ncbi:chloroplast sensor kinase [Actinidia rufa]|uniref:Chloroplast sensor kinase n=1 Tax=Actinidia rufa TaxID=165716 RepID=A0A7J0FMV7_9ERIC|nr:chloroplast sensor kinase [Actinidia rufa]
MLLSAVTLPLSNLNCTNCPVLFCPNLKQQSQTRHRRHHRHHRLLPSHRHSQDPDTLSPHRLLLLLPPRKRHLRAIIHPPNRNPLRHVCVDESEGVGVGEMVSSATAVAWAVRKASPSPVQFVQRIDEHGKSKGLVLPSPEFQRLCLELMDLFRGIVHADALLSVFVRPSGSYVMDQLELWRVAVYPGVNAADIVILFSNFNIPSGFLVAELPKRELKREEHDIKDCQLLEKSYAFFPHMATKSWEIQALKDNELEMYKFTAEQRLNAVNISCSLAMAYVMDQKAILLQQSSWQNNTRMSNLVEQCKVIVRETPFNNSRMLFTNKGCGCFQANIVRYNDKTLKKMHRSSSVHPESVRSQLCTSIMEMDGSVSLSSISKDVEMPMPPLTLALLQQQDIRRPSNVSSILADLVGAVDPLACKQERVVKLSELSKSLQVDVEEPALRHALSNLIKWALLRTHVGGKVEIVSSGAPTLVIIENDGLDMHYMIVAIRDVFSLVYAHLIDCCSGILESYGCVVRVISPLRTDAAIGAGGTHVKLWLPSSSTASDPDGPAQKA